MLFVLLVACALASPIDRLHESKLAANHGIMSFADWSQKFGKTYANEAEKSLRESIFNNNVERIMSHNAKYNSGEKTFFVALNQFGDLTKDEFGLQNMGKTMPPTNREKNWHKITGDTPASVDWRTKGAVSPVKNQGQCGSCWAFSTVGAIEGAYVLQVANATLTQFSEQELVSCASSEGNQGCNGGLMDNGFKWVEQHGLTTEQNYPYTSGTTRQTGTCDTSKEQPAVVYVTSYTDVPTDDDSAFTNALSQQPLAIAIEADKSDFQFYSGGVLSGSGCGDQLDHGVLAVGYGTYTGNKPYYLVKNSWGPTWGLQGYIMLERGSAAPADGECGLLKQASYPKVRAGSSPGPGPGPSPSPTGNDWKNPFTGGCNAQDKNVTISGVDGAMCSPACVNGACPNAPAGWSGANAQCALKDSAGDQYCALICSPTDTSACDPAVGATCKSIQSTGICTYNNGPSPGPGPGPSPSPSGPPYEDPTKNGGSCGAGETNIQIQNVSGGYCAPTCNIFKTCPAVPSTWATGVQAQCAVKAASGFTKYCALICSNVGGACNGNGMVCQSIQGTGICTYPDDSPSALPTLLELGF